MTHDAKLNNNWNPIQNIIEFSLNFSFNYIYIYIYRERERERERELPLPMSLVSTITCNF